MDPVNEELAQYSDLFMLIAALIYTGAFIVFAVDMVRSSATIRRLEAELAAEADQESRKARSTLVGADAGSAAGSTSVSEARDESSLPKDGAEEGGITAESRDLVDDDLAYVSTRRPFANVAVALTILAATAHLFAVVTLGVAANRMPLANMYEFLTAGALVVALVFLAALVRKDLRFLGTFAIGLVVVMMTAATIGFPTPVGNVQPALQSPWLAVHVTLAVLAMGLFTLTFAMNVLQLVQQRRELKVSDGEIQDTGGWQFMRMVPSATSLENWAYRINAVAFVFWTLGPLITGAIWAEEAWGRYWGWDVKEVWTFVIWVVYAGYLHARATRGWSGNRAAWLSIIGFVCIIFNYAVVNTLFPGLHSYAGLPQ